MTEAGRPVGPIELTIRPGRSVTVDLSAESRLEGVDTFSIVATSSATPAARSARRWP
ncbi:MAG: hypothetical protein R2695_03655 [Acidimicrobiales bacterium]